MRQQFNRLFCCKNQLACFFNDIVTFYSIIKTGDTPSNDDASTFVRNLTSSSSLHHSSSLSKQLKSASIAASLNAIAAASAANSQAQKFKGKRKSIAANTSTSSSISNAVDKMLSDRLNLADNKKFCDISNRMSSPVPSNNLTENSNGKCNKLDFLSKHLFCS